MAIEMSTDPAMPPPGGASNPVAEATDEVGVAPRHIEAFALRFRRDTPRPTPFGIQYGPQTVFLRVTDEHGAVGWGEAWGTFPSGLGIEHRAALIRTVMAPLLEGQRFASPAHAFAHLTRATRLLANHTGEAGPIGQVLAGIDIALWDLVARRAGKPLWRLLGGVRDSVPAYASGLDPQQIEAALPAILAAGYPALKLRIWGGEQPHADTLRRVIERAGPGVQVQADANQSWSLDEAVVQVRSFAGVGLQWIEEPLPADSTDAEWQHLRAASPVALAAGENLRGRAAFDQAIENGLTVVQPDMCKWGGVSGCLPLARDIIASGRRYFPHYLGGGIGFLCSAHLLAAAGGDGQLERDFHANPLRDRLVPPPPVVDGMITLPAAPGWGTAPDEAAMRDYLVT